MLARCQRANKATLPHLVSNFIMGYKFPKTTTQLVNSQQKKKTESAKAAKQSKGGKIMK